MEFVRVEEAVTVIEKAVNELEIDLLFPADASRLLDLFVRAERVVAAGKAVVAPRVDDAAELARRTGTSIGKAKEVLELSERLKESPELDQALRSAVVSLDQAREIAKTEALAPGSAGALLGVATTQPFHVLRDEARKVALQAQQADLPERQHEARTGRHRITDLGMVHIEADFEPHIGVPIVNRWEAEARRRSEKAGREGPREPFSAHLTDALAAMLSGKGKGPAKRPELVLVVSHGVAKRGWDDVAEGETCKIPGVGPVSPSVAKEIAKDAFLSAVVYDGVDLRQFKRWTRNIPIEVRIALELGEGPEFDGMKCVDCANRFRPEADHHDPHANGGPASVENMKPRCWRCHKAKTERDRREGKLRPARERQAGGTDERGPP